MTRGRGCCSLARGFVSYFRPLRFSFPVSRSRIIFFTGPSSLRARTNAALQGLQAATMRCKHGRMVPYRFFETINTVAKPGYTVIRIALLVFFVARQAVRTVDCSVNGRRHDQTGEECYH